MIVRRAVLFYLCIAIFAFAQSSSAPPSSKEINMDLEREDVFQRYSVVPVLGYTEETEFQYGFMALFFLKPDHSSLTFPLPITSRKSATEFHQSFS